MASRSFPDTGKVAKPTLGHKTRRNWSDFKKTFEVWSVNFGKFISELYNPSMTSRSFPDTCKVAKLMLTFAKTDPSIYRPISLMLLLSKVFVRIVLDQANDLFNLNKILYDY